MYLLDKEELTNYEKLEIVRYFLFLNDKYKQIIGEQKVIYNKELVKLYNIKNLLHKNLALIYDEELSFCDNADKIYRFMALLDNEKNSSGTYTIKDAKNLDYIHEEELTAKTVYKSCLEDVDMLVSLIKNNGVLTKVLNSAKTSLEVNQNPKEIIKFVIDTRNELLRTSRDNYFNKVFEYKNKFWSNFLTQKFKEDKQTISPVIVFSN